MRVMLWALSAGLVAVTACSKTEPQAEPVRAVRLQTVVSESAGGAYEYAAEIRARVESRLSFRVGGKVVSRRVELGDTVKAGQVLAELDPQDLRLSQEAARAAVAAAQVNFDQAQADLHRYRDLRDQGFISTAELERRDTTLKSAQASLQQAKAQANVQGNQAGYAALIADTGGVITGVDAEAGMVVNAGTTVVRLAREGARDAVFSVPEDKLSELRAAAARPGALTVKLWGSDDQALPATLREVGAAADPATRTFLVKADIGSAPARLGATATVSLELPRVDGAIKLPLAAIFEHQGGTAVWLLDPGSMKVAARPVQVAGADGNKVLIAGGLKPGEEVVTAGVHVLNPGQLVKRYVEPRPADAGADAKVSAR